MPPRAFSTLISPSTLWPCSALSFLSCSRLAGMMSFRVCFRSFCGVEVDWCRRLLLLYAIESGRNYMRWSQTVGGGGGNAQQHFGAVYNSEEYTQSMRPFLGRSGGDGGGGGRGGGRRRMVWKKNVTSTARLWTCGNVACSPVRQQGSARVSERADSSRACPRLRTSGISNRSDFVPLLSIHRSVFRSITHSSSCHAVPTIHGINISLAWLLAPRSY